MKEIVSVFREDFDSGVQGNFRMKWIWGRKEGDQLGLEAKSLA